jgi:hypothetical protein
MEVNLDRIRKGIHRLLEAPRDVPRWDRHLGDPGKQGASASHIALFDVYAAELGPAARRAEEIWDREIVFRAARSPHEDARIQHWMEYPAGPAAQPFMVALIRKSWLRCDGLNKTVPPQQAVAPEVLMLKWLADERGPDDVAVKVITCMPYWPLGLDKDGHWV